MPILSQIQLSKENEVFKTYQLTDNMLYELQQINLFVGANNSGKSRLLRELFIQISDYTPRNNEISPNIKTFEIFQEEINLIQQKILSFAPDEIKLQIDRFFNTLIDKKTFIKEYDQFDIYKNIINFINNNINPSEEKNRFIDVLQEKLYSIQSTIFTFIPTLRGIKKMKDENKSEVFKGETFKTTKDLYNSLKIKIITDYFTSTSLNKSDIGGNPTIEKLLVALDSIFTGEDIYERIYKLQNSGREGRRKITDLENFLQLNFFSNQPISICAVEKDNRKDVYIQMGNAPELPLHNLGDGIQQIIILTFPLFENVDKEHIYFVEEPELFLHAGMQRIFLETLKQFPKTQCFIATHSNHLLDMSIDLPISIYSLQKHVDNKEKPFEVSHLSAPDNNILDLLGVRNSSVFLANCTIWIEGISERIYFRKYLDLYQTENPDKKDIKKYHEDLHYSFVEYSGGNITHWSFVDDKDAEVPNIKASLINNHILLIADKDEGKEERHEMIKEKLGDENYCPLECLEVENLLSPEILKQTIKKYKTKLQRSDFNYQDYAKEPIANFIYSIIDNENKPNFISKPTKERKGRIYDKSKFAKNAVACINNWSDLSEEAQILTRKIYAFIEKHNKD